ncbi:MAG: bifunctional DNA-formamidopyrimidine glycosylase/DNA-(apurinic or apyrimidinic site) lyase, partial [Gemmatimonadota bacterium]
RAEVAGRTITGVGRRAKNIVLNLDEGEAVLLVNLGMTGRLIPVGFPGRSRGKPTHPAVRFGFGDRRSLIFDDTRRFGCLEVLDRETWAERSRGLGPEPLDSGYRWARLHRDLQTSRTPIRNWLLDQRRIAGVGNIYANEACFRAGLRPDRPAREITAHEARTLHRGIREVLRAGIRHGGTTLRDYRNADGEPGGNQDRLRVYGREGEPCPTCDAPVRRIVFGNRSAFFCPECQR